MTLETRRLAKKTAKHFEVFCASVIPTVSSFTSGLGSMLPDFVFYVELFGLPTTGFVSRLFKSCSSRKIEHFD